LNKTTNFLIKGLGLVILSINELMTSFSIARNFPTAAACLSEWFCFS